MLSKRLQDALNAQINAEFWSAYLYLSMSVDASAKGYKGVANWFAVQFKEEQAHAQIFINYFLARGGKVALAPIPEGKTSWDTPLEAFEDTIVHERKVTSLINELCHIAAEEKDFATSNMLVWFVDEQVEEEENVQEQIDAMRAVDGNKFGLYRIDKDLATRTYVTPTPLAGKE